MTGFVTSLRMETAHGGRHTNVEHLVSDEPLIFRKSFCSLFSDLWSSFTSDIWTMFQTLPTLNFVVGI